MAQRTVREMIERDRLVSAGPRTTVRRAGGGDGRGALRPLVVEGGRLLGIFTSATC